MQDWPFGPAGGAAGAFALESSTGSFLAPDSFLGFQFAPDGTLWTANESNGKVLLQDWPFGPASGAAGAFALESSTGSFLAADGFLGFQFADDGTLWTANEANGKVLLQDWPFGPGSGAAGAFPLQSSVGSYVYADSFLGFQFVTTPDPGTAVPEPATWALLIAGFGLAGGSLRRARALAA
ncbi:MAG: hypothetical protein DI570_02875 [Phenylobacterium zucineum]|nr:MAG: hypothetical protein DI570_02875 [Phenylobacterium zucineum]